MGYANVYTTDEVKQKLKEVREKYRFRTFTETLEAMLKVWEDAERRLGYGGLMEFLASDEPQQSQPQSQKRKITF